MLVEIALVPPTTVQHTLWEHGSEERSSHVTLARGKFASACSTRLPRAVTSPSGSIHICMVPESTGDRQQSGGGSYDNG